MRHVSGWDTPQYYMTAHNPTDNNLWLYRSFNGEYFSIISASELYVETNQQRDPTMIYYDSKWWICYTYDPNVGVINSTDLITWNTVAHVDMSAISSLAHTWAPSWFIDVDNSIHVFVACSTSGSTSNFQIYEVHPTNSGMTIWSSPIAITITGKSDTIDPFVVLKDGTYYIWYKEEDADYIEYASSSTLTGTYTPVQTGNWASWGSPMENPCLYTLPDGTWRIIFQQHSGFDPVQEWYSDSVDWSSWTSKKALGYSSFIPGGPSVIRKNW